MAWKLFPDTSFEPLNYVPMTNSNVSGCSFRERKSSLKICPLFLILQFPQKISSGMCFAPYLPCSPLHPTAHSTFSILSDRLFLSPILHMFNESRKMRGSSVLKEFSMELKVKPNLQVAKYQPWALVIG